MLPNLESDLLNALTALSYGFEPEEYDTEEGIETSASYYHIVSDKFENGKQVSHKEKEVRDGNVIKDIEQFAENIDGDEEVECEEFHSKNSAGRDNEKSVSGTDTTELCRTISELTMKNKELLNENKSLQDQCDKLSRLLKDKINEYNELINENRDMRCKLNNVKNKLNNIKNMF